MEVLYKRGNELYLVKVLTKYYVIHLYDKFVNEIEHPAMFVKQGYVKDANPTEEIKKKLIEIYEQNKV